MSIGMINNQGHIKTDRCNRFSDTISENDAPIDEPIKIPGKPGTAQSAEKWLISWCDAMDFDFIR